VRKNLKQIGSGDVTVALTGVSARASAGRLRVGTTAVGQKITKDWQVIYHLGHTARGQWTVARLEICPCTSDVPEGGVTMKLIRAITIAPARRYVITQKRIESLKPLPPRLRDVLRQHDRLVLAGDPHPGKTLAATLGENWSTVRTWLRRARELANDSDSARSSAHRL
jgi:hypothetical protein